MDRMMQFFEYAHLPDNLQSASKPFCELAEKVVAELPSNTERTVALRKLLEAKDAAVRAVLFKGMTGGNDGGGSRGMIEFEYADPETPDWPFERRVCWWLAS